MDAKMKGAKTTSWGYGELFNLRASLVAAYFLGDHF